MNPSMTIWLKGRNCDDHTGVALLIKEVDYFHADDFQLFWFLLVKLVMKEEKKQHMLRIIVL